MLRPTVQPALRASRLRCRPNHVCHFYSRRGPVAANIRYELDLNKLTQKRRDYESNRKAFLGAGAMAGAIAMILTGWKLNQSLRRDSRKESSAIQFDSTVPTEMFKTEAGEKRKIVIRDEMGREMVPTGNSTVPTIPRLLPVRLPSDDPATLLDGEGKEFTLVGLGTRTVTFLSIQVYVVGFYVATQDIAKLQSYLVKKVNPLASTLIPSEKDTLRALLRDPAEGEQTWDTLLRDAGCSSLFRITPVRDTDFHHLRDGFVRAIQGRSQRDKAYGDEDFGKAVKDFKVIFNRGQVPKKKEMLLCRDTKGALSVMYGEGDEKDPKRSVLGKIEDERVSRLLWLNYLAGKSVAAEGARQNIIEGLMEFVERPIGTVASQVI